ncbi:hypothetical protein ABZW18_26230 [Streptomyces sp. NPDC004647]|uniref:hypothetical protein n=1 Tax=Streptomyces sp. NPDC004647 TaxID=3154671 RepID=UPI0033AA521F
MFEYAYLDLVVRDDGRRGLVWHCDLRGVLGWFEDIGQAEVPLSELSRCPAEFLGMPEMRRPSQPLELWQQIPHRFDMWLTHAMNTGCLFCGLDQNNPVHTA